MRGALEVITYSLSGFSCAPDMISVVLLGDQRPLRSTIRSRRVVLRDAINFQRPTSTVRATKY
jgi:hypothetical protein